MINNLPKPSAPILGHICWWRLKNVSISRKALEDLFNLHGLDKRFLPPVVSGKKAFTRALKEIQKSKLVRKIKESEQEIIYGVVSEHVKPDELDIDYEVMDVIILDKVNELIRLKLHRLDYDWFKNNFSYFKSIHTADDIRSMIVNVLDALNAVLVRKHGGVYFVPKTSTDGLDKLANVINSIGSSEFYSLGIVDVEKTKKTAISLFKAEMEEELEKQGEKLAELVAKEKVRVSTLKHALDDYKKAKEKISMFTRILEFQAEDMKNKIEKMEAKVKEKLLDQISL